MCVVRARVCVRTAHAPRTLHIVNWKFTAFLSFTFSAARFFYVFQQLACVGRGCMKIAFAVASRCRAADVHTIGEAKWTDAEVGGGLDGGRLSDGEPSRMRHAGRCNHH